MTACLLYDKIHKNQTENLLHLMLYFSNTHEKVILSCNRNEKMIRYCYISIV